MILYHLFDKGENKLMLKILEDFEGFFLDVWLLGIFSVLLVWLVFSNFVVVWFLGFWCFVCLVGFFIILLCFGDWALNFVWF